VASVEDGIAAQIRNIEARYGRPMSDWFAVIAASGLTKHTEVVAMLKSEHGLAHGAAHRISLLSREAAAPAPPADPADALYTGKKAALRPLHDQLMTVIGAFGTDVDTVPKKGYLSLRRRKQFAMIQPSGAGPDRPRPDPAGRPGQRPAGAVRQLQRPVHPPGCGWRRPPTSTRP
jgi:Domain of unknown function (DUF4287)/Domain of unknown function (DUF5655)